MRFFFLALFAFWQAGCSYNVVQQQNGTRSRNQTVSIGGGGGYSGSGVGVAQGDGGQAVYIGGRNPVYDDPPPSTYPEYNGYPGSGYRAGPIGPAYDPRAWDVPPSEAWRYRIYFFKKDIIHSR